MSSQPNSLRYDCICCKGQKDSSRSSARVVLGELFGLLGTIPASIADVGCGVGTWLRVALDLGAKTAVGFDGDWIPRTELEISEECFIPCDLSRSAALGLPRPESMKSAAYDLVMSLDVAEHFPGEFAADFVAMLCNASELVIFSGAAPFQGGVNHVNEQWPSYWSELFLQNGFECFDPIRERVWLRTEVDWWYSQNVLIFAKGAAGAKLRAKVNPVRQPLPLVHPRKYLLQVAAENELRNGLVAATAAPMRCITPLTPKVERLERRINVLRTMLAQARPGTAGCDSGSAILDISARYDRLRALVYDLNNEVSRLHGELDKLRSALTLSRTSHEAALVEAQQARHETALLVASKSWRITSPLRAFMRAIERLLNGRQQI